MAIVVVSLAIIGKNNEPLFLKEFFLDAAEEDHHDGADVNDDDDALLFGIKTDTSAAATTTTTTTSDRTKKITKKEWTTGNQNKCSLKQQFVLHSALDRFEQLNGPLPPGVVRNNNSSTTSDNAMYVGLLCPIEDLRVYGYMTTTQIKFLLTVQDDYASLDTTATTTTTAAAASSMDDTIERLFVQLHRYYVEYILNPFSVTSGQITSPKFVEKVANCVSLHNKDHYQKQQQHPGWNYNVG